MSVASDSGGVKRGLRQLSPAQWKSGIAAWLGWLFDGLDMHLYTLVAAPFVAQLLGNVALSDLAVREKSSWIQAAFLLGWAVGGTCFGYVADRIGRSRALSLTILTYAVFTGLAFFAQTWWQLLLFRFVAALGIGGEWAVGSALLAETWPKRWRPWIAAVLQTGVNMGVLLACLVVWLLAEFSQVFGHEFEPRWVFLAGVAPAFIVYWIRKYVPEPAEWLEAKRGAERKPPGFRALFAPGIRRTTWLTIAVCATSLTGWWAFMFWHVQHLINLPELAAWSSTARGQLAATTFFFVIGASIVGNFFVGWLTRRIGYRFTIVVMFAGFFASIQAAFLLPHDWQSLSRIWFPAVGFFSGIFGLFTMYLPPLFPVLLRTTGAGFCYNIGRVAAAAGTVLFGLFGTVGDFRFSLLVSSYLFLGALVTAFFLPDLKDEAAAPDDL